MTSSKKLNLLQLWRHQQKRLNPKLAHFFNWNRKTLPFLEWLNSSLVLSAGELWPYMEKARSWLLRVLPGTLCWFLQNPQIQLWFYFYLSNSLNQTVNIATSTCKKWPTCYWLICSFCLHSLLKEKNFSVTVIEKKMLHSLCLDYTSKFPLIDY